MTQSQKDSIINEAVKKEELRHSLAFISGYLGLNDNDPKIKKAYDAATEHIMEFVINPQLSKAIDLAEKAALEERENIEG